jgi:signal transduction histidine kinase
MREIDGVTIELEGLEADALHRRLSHRNTTEVVRLTEALNRLLDRLDLSGKRLQRFTADAAHELRTPLAALRAHLDVALARTPSLETYRDGLLDAVEQTERLTVLAEDLLILSSIESNHPPQCAPVDMGAVAREVAEFLDAVAQEQGRRFDVEIDQPAIVWGEGPLLKRLLLNLLGNAFVHTPHGTAVRLVVRNEPSGVGVEVLDRGGGIGPAEQHVLFERFANRRSGQGGSGLGLAICREIITRHRGSISIDSGPDRGTTVRVRFPPLGSETEARRSA